MQVTHIIGAVVELVEVDFSLKGLEEYNSDKPLLPTSSESADASGYDFNTNDLHDVVIIFDYDGDAQYFIGPAGSFKH